MPLKIRARFSFSNPRSRIFNYDSMYVFSKVLSISSLPSCHRDKKESEKRALLVERNRRIPLRFSVLGERKIARFPTRNAVRVTCLLILMAEEAENGRVTSVRCRDERHSANIDPAVPRRPRGRLRFEVTGTESTTTPHSRSR